MSEINWKWEEFSPKIIQTDKRERENVALKGIKMIKKNFNELGISSFMSVPIIDRNRAVKKIVHVFPPNSPLEGFFRNGDNKKFVKGLEKAIEDTQMWALELWDLKDDETEDSKKRFNDLVGVEEEDIENDDDLEIKKPEKPIFAMTADEIAVFFGQLLKDLYKLEGKSKFKLWAKRDVDSNVVTEATTLKVYDDKAEEILPRQSYIGRGSGGPNIGNKLKICAAYLLSQHSIDHNTFAEVGPSSYRNVNINFENYDDLVSASMKNSKVSKSRAAKAKSVVVKQKKRHVELSDEEDNPPTKKSRPVPTEIASPPPRPSRVQTPARPRVYSEPSSSSNTTSGLVNFFRKEHQSSNSPGTPTNETIETETDEEDETDPRVYADIDVVKPGNVLKAHQGLITTVDVFNLEVCQTNGFYRASISDGENLSNKVLFNSKLNKRIEAELVGEAKVTTIKLEIVDILESVLVGVLEYTVIGEGPRHVGDATFVGEAFYRRLKPRGCLTPSRMRKKTLFNM